MALPLYTWLLRLARNKQFRRWLIAAGPVATKAFANYLTQMRHRESAIRQAEEIRGGFSVATIDGERHAIVWRDGKPFTAFPPVKGNLEEKLEYFDRERVQDPKELRRRKAQKWVQSRRSGNGQPPTYPQDPSSNLPAPRQ
jgi:hypothetical protein